MKTTSNNLLHSEDTDLAKRRLSTVKERYQPSRDILFKFTVIEILLEDIKDIQRTQAVKDACSCQFQHIYRSRRNTSTLQSLSRLQKIPINFQTKDSQIVHSNTTSNDSTYITCTKKRDTLEQNTWR